MTSVKDVPDFDHVLLSTADAFPPLAATVRAEFAARGWRAPTHAEHSDHYLVLRVGRSLETLLTSLPVDTVGRIPPPAGRRFDEHAYGMVIADGMGSAGEIASRLTVTALLQLALRLGKWQVRVDARITGDIIERLKDFYRRIDNALVTANQTRLFNPLHSTLTAVVSGGRDLFLAHVGHSRAYLLRANELIQLTRDQTHLVSRRTARAKIVNLRDVVSDMDHILTDALGAGRVDLQIDVEHLTLEDGDVVMLCSNGVTDVLEDAAIAEILASERTLEERCTAIVTRAAASGASDDATAVLARYHVPEETGV